MCSLISVEPTGSIHGQPLSSLSMSDQFCFMKYSVFLFTSVLVPVLCRDQFTIIFVLLNSKTTAHALEKF